MIDLLFISFILAQRGGGVQAPINVLPACDSSYGACPRADYFCRDSEYSIRHCAMPNLWTVIAAGKLATGTALPTDPEEDEVFVITDDSVVGACDSAAGSETSICRYNGSSWESIGGFSTATAHTWTAEQEFTTAQEWTEENGMFFVPSTTFPGGQSGGSCTESALRLRQFPTEPLDSGSDASGSCAGDDTELIWCGPAYNMNPSSCNARASSTDYALALQFTAGWTEPTADVRLGEWFLKHILATDGTIWHIMNWQIQGIDGATPTATVEFRSAPDDVMFQCNTNRCSFQGTSVGKGDLELVGGNGGGDLYLADDLKFEGSNSGDPTGLYQTTMAAKDPTANNSIIIPNATGRVVLTSESALAGIVRWGDGSEDAFDTGTELCSASDTTCVDAHAFSGGAWVDSACGTDQTGNMYMAFCRRNTGS